VMQDHPYSNFPAQSAISAVERRRYHRQMILSNVGEKGQQKLKAARVAIFGLGGLGAPCATYLAAAGVGRLTLIDHDEVDVTNLHRQVLFTDKDVLATFKPFWRIWPA
jgi:molybdopterin/thiamine biosynthesis adenylyltransferase